jgi:hypothetical protein
MLKAMTLILSTSKKQNKQKPNSKQNNDKNWKTLHPGNPDHWQARAAVPQCKAHPGAE